MYRNKKYSPLSLDEYLENAAFVITHISPDIVIHRISGDAPKDLLVAPDWNYHKKWIHLLKYRFSYHDSPLKRAGEL